MPKEIKSITLSALKTIRLYEDLVGPPPDNMPYKDALKLIVDGFGVDRIQKMADKFVWR